MDTNEREMQVAEVLSPFRASPSVSVAMAAWSHLCEGTARHFLMSALDRIHSSQMFLPWEYEVTEVFELHGRKWSHEVGVGRE